MTEPTKSELRIRLKQIRASLTADESRIRSHEICQALLSLPAVALANTVAMYHPVTGSGEVDVIPAIQEMLDRGARVALPVVTGFGERIENTPRMDLRELKQFDELIENRWKILEPTDGDTVALAKLDAIVVPALGASRNYHRIGYGKGYYDELLANSDAARICVVYHDCLLEHVPFEPHDVPVDYIVTESEIIGPDSAL